jgi:hypothetical protein
VGAVTAERDDRGRWSGLYACTVDHPDFQALTPNARLVFFVLRLGTMGNIASCFLLHATVLSEQTGLTAEELEAALRELERKPSARAPWIVRDRSVCWIRNGLRFDPNFVEENTNHVKGVRRAIAALPSSSQVVRKFRRYYKQIALGAPSVPPRQAPSVPPQGSPTPTPDSDSRHLTPNPNPTPAPTPEEIGDAHAGNGLKKGQGHDPAAEMDRCCRWCFFTWRGGPTSPCPRASEHRTRPIPGSAGAAIPGALRGIGG